MTVGMGSGSVNSGKLGAASEASKANGPADVAGI